MATAEEVLELRKATATEADDPEYTYEVLSGMIDDLGTVAAAAAAVWGHKAASYAEVVDVNESGSSRRLSQLHTQALAMKDHYSQSSVSQTAAGSFTVEIERV